MNRLLKWLAYRELALHRVMGWSCNRPFRHLVTIAVREGGGVIVIPLGDYRSTP